MEFDTEAQQAAYDNNVDLITAYFDSLGIESRPGTVINEMLVKPCAGVFAGSEASFSKTLDNLDIATAEDDYAELLLSNYGLSVKEAGPGGGYLILVTDSEEDLVIRSTVVFNVGSYDIILDRDYIGTLDYDEELSSDIYVPLRKYSESSYYMLIPATTFQDLEGELLPGTVVVPDQGVTGLVSSEIATPFVPVTNPVTLPELKRMVTQGVSAKILAGPEHIKALLTQSDAVPVTDVSVVGMNEPEMLRDSRNIFGASSGGYVDIYVRTAPFAHKKVISRSALRDSDGKYSVFINKDDAPGFYYVDSVSYNDATPTTDITMFDYAFGVDQSGESFKSNFPTPEDGRFTACQNCVVSFYYEGVPPEDTEPVFNVTLVYIPGIRDTQDFVTDPETRAPGSDYAVKAVVPVFMSVSLVVSYSASDARPDEDEISNLVADTVNSVPMGRQFLSGAEIAGVVQDKYPGSVVKLPVVMDGVIFDNAGQLIMRNSNDTFTVPFLPERGISHRTTAFMATPADIDVRIIGDK